MQRSILAGRLAVLAAATLALTAAACGADEQTANGSGPALPPGMTTQPMNTVEPDPPAVPFSAETPRYGVRVVTSWPHDPQAFTEGLTMHDGVLYESTGIEGHSNVRQVELATGKVLRRVDLPYPLFGEGIAVLDGRLYQLTWKAQKGFIYDAATLAPRDSFAYQGEGWSLTTDGTVLYMSDGTPTLRVLDPKTLQVLRTIQVTEAGTPVKYVNELEWVNGEIFANIWMKDLVARIDPATGRVTGWIDVSGLLTDQEKVGVDVTNGIAWDPARKLLLVTGKYWPRIFAVEIVKKP